MKTWLLAMTAAAFAVASTLALAADGLSTDVTTGRTTMTAAQAAQYRAEYQAAKAQWTKMTPQGQTFVIDSARYKKIKDLGAIERVGQNNDMARETAAQSGALKAEADAAKASWAKMTPAEKQAATLAAWTKKRAELSAIERAGQDDDTYLLPW